ncbi:metal-binding protein [Thermus thermamylovorans]|uniref:Hydrolase n=1 Tax=Thermus thermamylovorans TaxID=2509362 RepID=A0A4Q9B497_9DEIN|nr:metal-binding protein [Thermus thermamylovorans]TBH20758.1 hydrolase [Thermus thermamylovorans]
MPSGRVHEAINLTALGGAAAAYLAYGGSPEEPRALAFALAYLGGTFLLSPDLDLSERGVRAQRRWGLLGLLWRPYGWLFRHRGLSHTWVLGPLTRLGYLAVLLGGLLFLAQGVAAHLGMPFSLRLPPWPPEVWGFALLGYYLSQWLHLAADGLWPDHDLKRLKRPR